MKRTYPSYDKYDLPFPECPEVISNARHGWVCRYCGAQLFVFYDAAIDTYVAERYTRVPHECMHILVARALGNVVL